ncbi:hypothetical protein [Paracoccus sp. S1E-3]|uniref:hypothetical protein n=1 Tax=Paracoccus sp. S1E-3 TaxID=2756130 RepID=UPI0015EFBFF7|nr:hypothetical protein [Paracoccus sp. S1E-3]MBA4491444.1 hypothetical protein [Paracoccus sp. S1E-3]
MTEKRGTATLAIALCAALAVLAGLVVSGGPVRSRKEGRDDDRLRDLRQISANIRCQAEESGRVPDAPQMTDLCPSPFVLQNPETGETYRYSRVDDRHWRLCAAFELPDRIRLGGEAQFDARNGCLLDRLNPGPESKFAPMDQLEVRPPD